MRFQINGQGWPLQGGAALAPAGTVIDWSANDHWSLYARGLTIPMNATPLDDEARQAQLAAYPNHKYLLGPPR
jgi:hypothetical protein